MLSQQILHVPVAQGELEIKPNRVLDDGVWELGGGHTRSVTFGHAIVTTSALPQSV
jgi:hypothetical protein